jgi:hypothetical protein
MKPLFSLLSVFALSVAAASATTILVDFGSVPTTGDVDTWNNVTNYSSGLKVSDLATNTGSSTGYGLSITTSGFNGYLNESPTTLTPETAYRDSFFGNYQIVNSAPSIIRLTGLDPSISYTFTFFASLARTGERGTRYTIGSDFAEIQAAQNVDTWTIPITATPDANGNLDITVSRSAANTNESYAINVMRMDYTIPEPTAPLLTVLPLLALATRRQRRA